jgi:hypothetical protein
MDITAIVSVGDIKAPNKSDFRKGNSKPISCAAKKTKPSTINVEM